MTKNVSEHQSLKEIFGCDNHLAFFYKENKFQQKFGVFQGKSVHKGLLTQSTHTCVTTFFSEVG